MMKSSKSQPKFKIYATRRVIKRSKSENGGRQKSSNKFNSLMYLKPKSFPKVEKKKSIKRIRNLLDRNLKQAFEWNLSISERQESVRTEKLNRMILKLAENRKEDSEVIEDLNQSFSTISTKVCSRFDFQVANPNSSTIYIGDQKCILNYFNGSFLQRQLMIANYHVKKFVRNSQ